MTVSQLTHAQPAEPPDRRSATAQPYLRPAWQLGQHLDLTVLGQAGPASYWVAMGSSRQLVESALNLRPGDTIQTEVVKLGVRTELRYLGLKSPAPRPRSDPHQLPAANSSAALVAHLAGVRKVALSPDQQQLLAGAVENAVDGEAMTLGGLYLVRLDLPLETAALEALAVAQTGGAPAAGGATELLSLVPRVLRDDADALAEAVQLLDAAMGESVGVSASSVGSEQSDSDTGTATGDFTRWLLNQHDGSSAGYRYGAVPVMVAGQLQELDLVYFHHPRPNAEAAPLRRLVMTLKTETFGRVEVVAEAVDSRLLIRFAAERAGHGQLAARADEVRDFVVRLGWSVDSVTYDAGRLPSGGARQVINHVLDGGQFSRLL